jgi:hypothetical protein
MRKNKKIFVCSLAKKNIEKITEEEKCYKMCSVVYGTLRDCKDCHYCFELKLSKDGKK